LVVPFHVGNSNAEVNSNEMISEPGKTVLKKQKDNRSTVISGPNFCKTLRENRAKTIKNHQLSSGYAGTQITPPQRNSSLNSVSKEHAREIILCVRENGGWRPPGRCPRLGYVLRGCNSMLSSSESASSSVASESSIVRSPSSFSPVLKSES